MRIVDLTADDATLHQLYRDVLSPSFPPDELVSLEFLLDSIRDGHAEVSVALDDSGRVLAGAVGEWSASSRVMLLSYLAVAPGSRASGIGTSLYEATIRRWRAKYRPCLVLAEVERPDLHAASPVHGDPAARLRFYGRHGGGVLDLPYFQPALGPGRSRVFGLLLLALWVDPELTGEGGPDTVAPDPLLTFVTGYLAETEGGVDPADPAAAALLRALDVPTGVPVLPAERYREVPAVTG